MLYTYAYPDTNTIANKHADINTNSNANTNRGTEGGAIVLVKDDWCYY